MQFINLSLWDYFFLNCIWCCNVGLPLKIIIFGCSFKFIRWFTTVEANNRLITYKQTCQSVILLVRLLLQHVELAKEFDNLARDDERFEVTNEVKIGVVCFRLKVTISSLA